MAQKKQKKTKKIEEIEASVSESQRCVLVATYKKKPDQMAWIRKHSLYNYPLSEEEAKISNEGWDKVKELWLYSGPKDERQIFDADFVDVKSREEFLAENPDYPKGKTNHGNHYVIFKVAFKYQPTIGGFVASVRISDFARRTPKIAKAVKEYQAGGEIGCLLDYLPGELASIPHSQLYVCEANYQLTFWDLPEMKAELKRESDERIVLQEKNVCAPIAGYSRAAAAQLRDETKNEKTTPIRVVELFAGVGGFRIGLERASNRFETIWNNQWEPATKRQDASIVYQSRFGIAGHSNNDIATVPVSQIPEADLLVGGFPCQDYSVATTLKNAGGIEGKKGVLWWQIHRILRDSKNPPPYLFLENVDRLLKSPALQRGRDFAIILASLSDLGYEVEWRVINAADYGMPQRRRRTYIVAYRMETPLAKEASKGDEAKWIFDNGVIGTAFSAKPKDGTTLSQFEIGGTLPEVSSEFNAGAAKASPFMDAGLMIARHVWTQEATPLYDGTRLTLGQLVVDESEVPEEFFIDNTTLEEWKYLKGPKSEMRKTPEGFEYHYTEGGMAFPDSLDKPSRTIITGEGGSAPSRFKHVILTPSGRYRRLIPLELERLNMFPDNHTQNASDGRRAFLMGNALVTGIVERIGLVLKDWM